MTLNKEDRDLNYSRQFDVHTWSSCSGVNIFANDIYETFLDAVTELTTFKRSISKTY